MENISSVNVFIRSLHCSSGDVWAYKTSLTLPLFIEVSILFLCPRSPKCQIPSCRSIKYKSSNSDVTNSTHIKKEKKRKEKDLSPQIIEDKQIMTYLALNTIK
jgi:hypothetical protein